MLPALCMLLQVKGFCHQLLLIGRWAKPAWLISADSKGNCVLVSCTIQSTIRNKEGREHNNRSQTINNSRRKKHYRSNNLRKAAQHIMWAQGVSVTYWGVFWLVPSSTRWTLSTKLGMSTTLKEEAILVLLASCSAFIEMLMSSLEISPSFLFLCGMELPCFSEVVFQNKLAPRTKLDI